MAELETDIAQPFEQAFVARLANAVAAMHFGTQISARMLVGCLRLAIVVFLGTGAWSLLDLAAAASDDIRVGRILGYAGRTVAEHALVLIFGLGPTRATLAALLRLPVVGWNRSPVPARISCRIPSLDEVMASAAIVSLHLALNDETPGVIARRRIGLRKPGALLIGTARGALLDEEALLERLRKGDVLAGCDVFAGEPVAPGYLMVHLDNLVLPAHAGCMRPGQGRRVFRLGLQAMRQELAQLDEINA